MPRETKSQKVPQLFTYTIPVDDGAAPNPFRGMCTLAICKPGIRRAAQKGDWVAGLGSKNSPSGNLSGRLVYAMRVEKVLTLKEYDRQARRKWPHRIPNIVSADLSERLGDCIYDYSKPNPKLRPSVHGPKNRKTDLRGENALISRHFYYFGSRAIEVPRSLRRICHQTQGHKSHANDPYVRKFVAWLRSLKLPLGEMFGWPDYIVDWNLVAERGGCLVRKSDGERDGPC
jgi:Nucleotide modification associated domain 2